MNYSGFEIWLIVLALGVGTYLIRFSFLGVMGRQQMAPWVLRHLRYTSVGILPAMVTPLVFWPAANEGATDPARVALAGLALAVGYVTKSAIWAVVAGMGGMFALGWLALA